MNYGEDFDFLLVIFYHYHMKKTFSYSVFYKEAPEGGYVAFVPALPGCHTQGETLEDAEVNIKEAIELYLEDILDRGEPVPQEGKSFQGVVNVPVTVSE